MGLKKETSTTQIATDVACSVAMATLDELQRLARGRVLEMPNPRAVVGAQT
jgi:hypothetical protein